MKTYLHQYVKMPLEDDIFDEIIQITNKQTDFISSEAAIFDGNDYVPDPKTRRKSKSCVFRDENLIEIIENITRVTNIKCNWNFDLSLIEDLDLIHYHPGDYFTWHTDEISWTPGRRTFNLMRKLSFTILLNDDFTGGEFDVFTTKQHTIPLKKKDIVIFHSDILHQVRPILSGTRHALVGWIQGPPWR